MPRKPAHLSRADEYLNEVIGMPGFPGHAIRRGCVLIAMREAGFDKRAAELYACTDRLAPAEWPLLPQAREVFAALLNGDTETASKLLVMGGNGGPALDDAHAA